MSTDEQKILDQVDERIRSLGKRVGDHEELKEQIKALNSKLEVQHNYINKLFQDDVTFAYKASEINKLIDARFSKIEQKFDTVLANQKQIMVDQFSISDRLDSMNKKMDQDRAKFSESEKKVDSLKLSISELKDRFAALNSHMQGLQSTFYENDERINIVSSKTDDVNKLALLCLNQFKEDQQQTQKVLAQHDSMHTKLLKQFNKNIAELEEKIKSSLAELDEKVSSIQVPGIDHLASNDTVTKLQRSIEIVSMDAKNAFLKSNNNEMQNQIITKKIEGLQIALKTHELGNAK